MHKCDIQSVKVVSFVKSTQTKLKGGAIGSFA